MRVWCGVPGRGRGSAARCPEPGATPGRLAVGLPVPSEWRICRSKRLTRVRDGLAAAGGGRRLVELDRCCACACNRSAACAIGPASIWCCGRGRWRGLTPWRACPQEDPFLEFHLDCRQPGEFSDACPSVAGRRSICAWASCAAARCNTIRTGKPAAVAAGVRHGPGPVVGVLREALRQDHQGAIRVIHLAHDADGHYLAEPLEALARAAIRT